jgi:hypothetical protein
MIALIVCIRFSAWSNTIECRGLEDLVGDLEGVPSPVAWRTDALPDGGVPVVERGQAVHELDVRVARGFHRVRVDLVGPAAARSARPTLLGLAHRDPDVGVDEVDARHALARRRPCACIRAPVVSAMARAIADDDLVVPQVARCRDAHVHAHEGAGDQQRVGGVVAGVAAGSRTRSVRAAWSCARAW